MSSSWMLRAAAAPERFLDRGFARFLARSGALRRPRSGSGPDLGVVAPADLVRFLRAVRGGQVGSFLARPRLPRVSALLQPRDERQVSQLVGLLAGGIPFGETAGDVALVYLLTDATTFGLIASVSSKGPPAVLCRGAAEYALLCAMEVDGQEIDEPGFGIADHETVRVLVERARIVARMLTGADAAIRAGARELARRPAVDIPPVETTAPEEEERAAPLAFGGLLESFLMDGEERVRVHLAAHLASTDALVRTTSRLLFDALEGKPRAPAPALAARRAVARKAQTALAARSVKGALDSLEATRAVIARLDALPPNAETFAAVHEREETLLELATLGDRRIAPVLLARAVTGDAGAVDMLAALGDRSLLDHTSGLLAGERTRVKNHDAALVRMLGTLRVHEAAPALRQLLAENPMTNWREGLERGVLVRDLVTTLGELGDTEAGPLIVGILESTSQEYRAILPVAAHALGRLHHAPALPALERLLFSPKDPVSCEAIWAVGAIAERHPEVGPAARAILERLANLEPGAEVTRLAALFKLSTTSGGPSPVIPHHGAAAASTDVGFLRDAIDRALWEPAFRQEESSRRRAWALRALEELAEAPGVPGDALFLGHEAIRHLVTRDDHRVRRAAESAFRASGAPIPDVRRYHVGTVVAIEREGGVPALAMAVRDPLGIFRHNVATRLAEIGDPAAVRPLAEATARLFAEPPTSTYEYDDAPPSLTVFVRALAKLNRPDGNDVLIEGLRSENHQVRAVVAENAPDDERFVPELKAMLGDPRSFLRSRAEKSLTSLGAIPAPVLPGTTEVATVARRVEG